MTGRASVLGLVLIALLLAYAYPVRVYLSQQAQIAQLETDETQQRQRISDLSEQNAKFDDPEYVKSVARRRLHMVLPGEVAYVVFWDDPNGDAAPSSDPDAGKAKDVGAWYDKLWSSVQAADKPRQP